MTFHPSTPTRRSVVRAAAWTAPAITVAVAAPAFASSGVTLSCTPSGSKAPGEGDNTKDYFLTPGCNTGEVTSVTIDGTPATFDPDQGVWVLRGRPESDTQRYVVIETTAGQWSGMVQFLPRQG